MEKGKGVLKPVMARGCPGKEEFGGWRKPVVLRITKNRESRIICWIDWNSRGLRCLRKPSWKHKGHGTSYIAQFPLLCSQWIGNSHLEHLTEDPLRKQTTITINFHPEKLCFPCLKDETKNNTQQQKHLKRPRSALLVFGSQIWALQKSALQEELPDLG